MKNNYPWYDSPWLNAYVKAKCIIKKHYPRRLEEFVAAFEPLRTDPKFKVQKVNRIFDEKILIEARELIRNLKTEALEKQELFQFGRLVVHDHTYFNQLQDDVTDLISDAVREPVESSYNFLSIYNNLGTCQVHMDAPSAKWTLDVCLEQTAPWPIYFSQVQPWPETFNSKEQAWADRIKNDPKNIFTEYCLQEGEAVIFSGSSQWHFRNRIPNLTKLNYCHLVFFHFIPKGMRAFTEPENWATIFAISELASVVNNNITSTAYTIPDVLTAKKIS